MTRYSVQARDQIFVKVYKVATIASLPKILANKVVKI